MAERAMVFETAYLGVEATPNTPVQATKKLGSLSFTVTPTPEVKTFTAKGYKFPTASVLIKEWTAIKVDGIGTYDEMVYPLASVLTTPVITTPGGGTLSRDWVFSMSDTAPDSQKTFSMQFGTDSIRAGDVNNVIFTELGFTFSRKDFVKLSGSGIGQAYQDDKTRWLSVTGTPTGGTFTVTVGANTTSGIAWNAAAATVQTAIAGLASVGAGNVSVTGGPFPGTPMRINFAGGTLNTSVGPTLPAVSANGASLTGGSSPAATITRLSPGTTELARLPIGPTTIDIKVALTQAGLGAASALTRDFQYTWKVSNRDNPFFPLNSSNGTGFGGTVEATPKGEITLDVEADDAGMALLAYLRTNQTVFIRLTATGPAIETGYYNSLTLDTSVRITKMSDFKDVDGTILGTTFTGEFLHDPTWGYATQATVRTASTAL